MNRQTLDLDWYFLQKHKITPDLVIEKLNHHCGQNIFSIECWFSQSLNGYHIIIWCQKESCDLCRLLFDDQKRFQNDLSLRHPYERNVLFYKKVKVKRKCEPKNLNS